MSRTRALVLSIVVVAGCSAPREAEVPRIEEPTVAALVEELAALRAEAFEAHEEGDIETLRSTLRAAHRLQPGSPAWTFNLAATHAAAGDASAALSWARRTAELGAVYDYAADPDLRVLNEAGALASLHPLHQALERPLMNAHTAFSLGAHDLIVEAVAYDAPRRRFLVSSARTRSVLSVDEKGRVSPFVSPASHGLGAALGIAVDPERGWLWVCSANIPEMVTGEDEPPVEPSVMRFDLERGTLISTHPLPPAPGRRTPNDLAVLADGTLLVSDSTAGAIVRLPPGGDQLETLVPPGTLRSPQGVAPAPLGGRVVLADYSLGLLALDPGTGELSLIEGPESPTLVGIDGLSRHGLGFVAVQNGIRPARVLRIEVSGDLARVEAVTTLERAHPAFDEPTSGCVVGDDFYFVANSHWTGFDEAGAVLDRLPDHIVMRLGLPPE